ncbi:hypothetical protein WS86_00005 (plasmid) [Burkholderia savannae]|nr:hypothetical protein WS86_00005 [Burkholderia savannae]
MPYGRAVTVKAEPFGCASRSLDRARPAGTVPPRATGERCSNGAAPRSALVVVCVSWRATRPLRGMDHDRGLFLPRTRPEGSRFRSLREKSKMKIPYKSMVVVVNTIDSQ